MITIEQYNLPRKNMSSLNYSFPSPPTYPLKYPSKFLPLITHSNKITKNPKNKIKKQKKTMNFTKTPNTTLILFTILLITTFTPTHAVRPDPDDSLNMGQGAGVANDPLPTGQGGNFFDIPNFSKGVSGGFGFGFGGPNANGGFSKSGFFGNSQVCQIQGPCYQMKLTCPEKCFSSFSKSGEGYNIGGGGGGCSFDCKTTCTASC